MPIGFLAEFGELPEYVGADVDRSSLHWCRKYIEAAHPRTEFVRLDVANARYNRGGKLIDDAFRLPWDSARFDAIFLYSVFSHMEADDIRAYLREFRRLLRPNGGVFLTAFVEDGVPDVEVNPADYGPLRWRGALHCVRYSTGLFDEMVGQAGFSITRTDRGTETDGQSALYLRVRSVG